MLILASIWHNELVKQRSYHSRKYFIDEGFFDVWSSTMAYVLGFWFADGYMRKEKSYRIVFCGNDLQILRDIRKAFKAKHPLQKSNRDQSWGLNLFSKRLYEQLQKLGGVRGKSKILTFPLVPKMYLRDFIRGYFDGDGSVCFVKYIRTKDQRLTKELRTNFTSGSRTFLESLMNILHTELGLALKVLGVFNDGASLKLGYGMKDSDALLHYMYYRKFPIGLKRKAAFLFRIPKYQKHFIKKNLIIPNIPIRATKSPLRRGSLASACVVCYEISTARVAERYTRNT